MSRRRNIIVGIGAQIFGCNNQAEEIFAYDQGTRCSVIDHLRVDSWPGARPGESFARIVDW
jgi:hypothetical protein